MRDGVESDRDEEGWEEADGICVGRVNCRRFSVFFFNDTATTEIYTLSLHDALPILIRRTFSPAYQL